MSDVSTKAARYLTPPDGAFWRWSDDGDVIEWSNGPTIAFRSEVAAVLARLTPHGLPAMELVVLLLAACRDTWGEDPRHFDILTRVHTLKARISAVQWIRDTIEQCEDTAVAVFVKQLGTAPKADIFGRDGFNWPHGTMLRNDPVVGRELATFALRDPKGGDPSEWPEDLRMRELPR